MPHPTQIILEGKTYNVVTLDFETYYDTEYSLSKMSTSEYVRDERFKAHGVGIKHGNAQTLWYTGGQIEKAISEIDWESTALIAHNAPFDGFILHEVYGVLPALFLDTLAISRAVHGAHIRHDLDTLAKMYGLGGKVKRDALANTKGKRTLEPNALAKLGGYCVDDTNDTHAIFWEMYDYMPDDELRLVDLTTRMFCDPVLEVDIPRVEAELEKELGHKAQALKNAGVKPERLVSNPQFAEELKKLGVNPPIKTSPTTGRPTFAFAKNDLQFQALMDHPDAAVRNLVRARVALKSSIGETRARRFLEAGKDGAKLPVGLNYCGAHTTRWSGANKMNLQNLRRGGELRKSIMAPPGHVVVVADSEQIEARTLAWLADQMDIVNAFANKQDVYKLMASSIYGRPPEDITDGERFIGKVCVLGLGYGMGHKKLRLTLAQGAMGPPVEVSEAEAKRIVDLYRRKNNHITELWDEMDTILRAMMLGDSGDFKCISYGENYIRLPNGLFMQYPKLEGIPQETWSGLITTDVSYASRYGRTRIYKGLLTENVTQALARCIIAEQMLEVADKYRIVTMTHDEIVAVAPTKQAETCYADMVEAMSRTPEWAEGLPLAAKGGFDVNYSK